VQLTLFASSGENGAEAAPETIEAGAGQAGLSCPWSHTGSCAPCCLSLCPRPRQMML